MKELILVRHGHPDHMVRNMSGGWTASHLTEIGRRQAKLAGDYLAQMLSGREFAFYTSDLPRAAETAEIIGQAVGIVPTPTPQLREKNNGSAANMTVPQAARIGLPATQPVVDWIPYPEAESWRMAMRRVWTFLHGIDTGEQATVLLVSHGEIGIGIVYWWLGMPAEAWPRAQFEFDLCSITHLITGEWDGRRILRLNDTSHLAQLNV